jgi:hypothetical protein
MKTVLKSPFHSLVSGGIMIITFEGIKSGRKYSTPISYYADDGWVYCFTHANWWRNFQDGAKVKLRMKGKDYQAFAHAIPNDIDQKSQALSEMLTELPTDARFYGVTLGEDGKPNAEQVEQAAIEAVMIKVRLEE